MNPKQGKGIVKIDPWRSTTPTPNEELQNKREKKIQTTSYTSEDNDIKNEQHTTLSFPGYGGITVDGVNTTGAAALRILEFCINNLERIEPTLLNFGVVVHKLNGYPDIPFYIQRKDGWTLMVPQTETRESGFLQLIQAFLDLHSQTTIRPLMTKAEIRPYKM